MRHFLKLHGGKRQAGRKFVNGVLAFLCVCAMVLASLSPYIPAMKVNAASAPRLSNLIIDKVYELQPVGGIPDSCDLNSAGFAPDILNYEGTAYSSVAVIKVYPFAESPDAVVTVNGRKLEGDGYVPFDVQETGEYPLEVKVTQAGQETVYKVALTKVDTDYRERRAIVKNEKIVNALSVTTEAGKAEGTADLLSIMKKDYLVTLPESRTANTYVDTDETYWSPAAIPVNEAAGTPTSFTVDLGDIYSVSRIRAVTGPSNLGLGGNKVRISVSTDGENWETPVTKGNLNTGTQYHQNVIRYEFGVSHKARYIKYEITHWQNADKNLRLYQFMVYYDSGYVPEEQPAPEGGSLPHQHEERHQYLAGGQATIAERGITLSGWTPSGGYGRGIPTREEAEQFGYDGPLFYDPDFENLDYMLYNPDARWGISKAPFGGNGLGSAGEPRDFIPSSMKPYIGNAISFCFGDEGGYNTAEGERFGKWFQWTREHYPGVILHSNQFPNQWSEANLLEYFRLAQPDMITWDDYYGDSSWANPSSINLSNPGVQVNAARRLLNLNTWDLYRRLAYGGLDGSGSQPILFGQYLDAFAFNHTTSSKNMIANLSILSGAKWLNFFRVEYQFDRSYLWDEDGTPTRGLLEWGEIIDRIHAIDPQMGRLNNDWIMFKLGTIGSAAENNARTDGFRRGNFDSGDSAAKNAEFGIEEVTAKSLSTVHNGGTGDVILGYYNTLPGLYESEAAEYFAGAANPKAFMVMNGLVAGQAERYNSFNIPAREMGASENTRQEITIVTSEEFADKTLYLVDKDDRDENGKGKIKTVARKDDGSFTIVLGGGESSLYFWGTGSMASATSQSEGAYASFAFDSHPSTYWQPQAVTQDNSYVLENSFAARSINQVTITEKGDAIQEWHLEYRDADGSWKAFGDQGAAVGGAATVKEAQAVTATGIRLNIGKASGMPAVYEVEADLADADPNGEQTLTVNDNTMGTGLNSFSYSDLWSYREVESGSTSSAIFPLENDGHFSNFADAQADFRFYGGKVELLLRSDQASHIKAQVFASDGTTPVSEVKSGNGRSLIFDNLEQDVYTLRISKKDSGQAGIDGAKVTWRGSLPEGQNEGADAVQVYLNQRDTDSQNSDYFIYEPSWKSVYMPTNNSHFGVYADEQDGWVEHVQDMNYQNCGFTRTNKADASYTIHFYGTGVQLHASSLPVDGNTGIPYGDLSFELDGKPVEASYSNTGASLGNNAKITVRLAEIQVPGAQKNGNHTLKVTVNSGYNRIDYAVVNRYWEKTVQGDYNVTVDAGEHGTAELLTQQIVAGGSAVIQITPDEGYQINQILVNKRSVAVPEDGRLVISNINSDMMVNITFREAVYGITVEPSAGGTMVPDRLASKAGSLVTMTADPAVGYALKESALTVMDSKGGQVEVRKTEADIWQFTMPADKVKIQAAFDMISYEITVQEGITGGTVITQPEGSAGFRQLVTVLVQPQKGYRLTEDRLKAQLADGSTLALDPGANSGEYTFVMPAQKVSLSAAFEMMGDYEVKAGETEHGSTTIENPVVMAGEDTAVVFIPDEGYVLGALSINGEMWYVPTDNRLVLKNIESDMMVGPVFTEAAEPMFMASASVNDEAGGAVEPAQQKVARNGSAVLFVNVNPGYFVYEVAVKNLNDNTEQTLSGNDVELQTVSGNENSAGGQTQEEVITYAVSLAESGRLIIPDIAGDVEIEVCFARTSYALAASETENGSLNVSAAEAGPGEEVTITVKPAEGYRLVEDSLKAATGQGQMQNITVVEEGRIYTFKMPAANVTITAEFEKVPRPGPDPDSDPDPGPGPDPDPDPGPNPDPDPGPNPDPAPAPSPSPDPDNNDDQDTPAASSGQGTPRDGTGVHKSPSTDTVEIGTEGTYSPKQPPEQDKTVPEKQASADATAGAQAASVQAAATISRKPLYAAAAVSVVLILAAGTSISIYRKQKDEE